MAELFKDRRKKKLANKKLAGNVPIPVPETPTPRTQVVASELTGAALVREKRRLRGLTRTPEQAVPRREISATTPTSSISGPATAPGETPDVIATPDVEAFKTEEEKASELAGDLFGEPGLIKTSLDETIKDIQDRQREESERQAAQLKLQAESDRRALTQAERSVTSGLEGARATFAQDREGLVSSTAGQAFRQFEVASKEAIDEAQGRFESANLRRDELQIQLEDAQKNQRRSAVIDIRRKISLAEAAASQAQKDLIDSQRAVAETALKIDQQTVQNVNTFKGILQTGADLTPKALFQFADLLNLPAEVVFGLSEGTQSIRDDKSLSNQEKALALQQQFIDLDNAVRGVQTEKTKNLDFLSKLRLRGASEEELSEAKELLGIRDEDDPLFQIELRQKEAQALIAEFEADNLGKPPPEGTLDRLKFDQAKLELNIANREFNELLGGEFDVGDVPDTRLVTGGASSGAGRVDPLTRLSGVSIVSGQLTDSDGNSLGKITSLFGADNSDVSGEKVHNAVDVVFNNGQVMSLESGTIVKAGVSPSTYGGYVWAANSQGQLIQYGHVNVEEAKAFADRLGDGEVINLGQNEIFINHETDRSKQGASSGAHTDIRFVGNAERKQDGAADAVEGTLLARFTDQAKEAGLTDPEQIEEFAQDRLKDSFKPPTESQGKALKALFTATAESATIDEISKDVDLVELSDQTGFIKRKISNPEDALTAETVNRLISDPNTRAMILSEMRWVSAVLREESGAAISAQEYFTKGAAFFARKGDDESQIETKRVARGVEERGLRAKIGASGERQFLEELETREELRGAGAAGGETEQTFFGILGKMFGVPELVGESTNDFEDINLITPQDTLDKF